MIASKLKKYFCVLTTIVACLWATNVESQNVNVSLAGQLSYSAELSDIWGYVGGAREYAIVTLTNGISIVEVTDPTAPAERAFISGASSSWREAKTYGTYAYVTNETGGGLAIIDLSSLPTSASSTNWTGGTFQGTTINFNTAHNIFIDENGIGYLVGANYGVGGAIMIDIAANPTNPPIVGIYNTRYIHDCFVRDDIMWSAEINNGIFSVVDVSDKANPVVLATQSTPNNFTHNCWPSDDDNYLFTTDEISGAPVGAYDVSDLTDIVKVGEYRSNPGSGVIPHNTFYHNGFLVTSYYRDGITIVDASNPNALVEVGNYDTSPSSGNGFNGSWGVYPYLPSGVILASDIEEGLFVLQPTYVQAAFLEGLVTDLDTGNPIPNATITITGLENTNTDFGGNYTVGTASAGTYTITVSAPGYDLETITGVSLTNGNTTTVNVQLESNGITPPPTYCNSEGENASFEWIAEVNIGDINNVTGSDNGYGDYTSIVTDLERGNLYNISLTPDFSNQQYDEWFRIWIDYNQDGDFEDADELAYDSGAASPNTVTGAINIPATALLGSTGMRVSMKWNNNPQAPEPCETFQYGEVEDYTVNIVESGVLPTCNDQVQNGGETGVDCGGPDCPPCPPDLCETPTNLDVTSVDNTSVVVTWDAMPNAIEYNVQYQEVGGPWITVTTTNNVFTIGNLLACTMYNVQVQAVCGPGKTSDFAETQTEHHGHQHAAKPIEKYDFEIKIDETEPSHIKDNQRVSLITGLPLAIYSENFKATATTPEGMARQYLKANARVLGLNGADLQDFQLHAVRESQAGTTVRLRQFFKKIRVGKAEITVNFNKNNEVVNVMNGFRPNVKLQSTTPVLSHEKAKQTAFNHVKAKGNITYENTDLMVYYNRGDARLAYDVTVSAQYPGGEWQVLVDAHTGEVFKAVDNAHYIDGTGNVFDPDPLSSAGVGYGGGYSDNGDANSPELLAQQVNVPMRDIDFDGSVYTLKGPYAEIRDSEAPNNGLFQQTNPNWDYNREDDAFEAANVYYHVDASMRYINEVLLCNIMPYQYTGGVRFDPSGLNGSDNSHYSGGSGEIAFGEGCVDDSEDSDVIHHELGHGLHDWVTSGGLSQVDGLSEGSGDYWAQSYNRSLGLWTPADPQYNWVFNWDGHNECWGGRVTNYGASYPGGLTGGIHADGQIWATCLMGIWDQIGQQQIDKAFLEGLGMTNGSSSQNDAAVAVYQAAVNMGYPNAEIIAIHNSFTACGYTLPPLNLDEPPVANFTASATTICLDNNPTIQFDDLSSNNPTAWDWTFAGGTPATSTLENPSVTYTADGVYDVTLTVTNSFGSDTETMTGYITVVSGSSCPCNYTLAMQDSYGDGWNGGFLNVLVNGTSTGTYAVTSGSAASAVIPVLDGQSIELVYTSGNWEEENTYQLFDPSGTQLFADGPNPQTGSVYTTTGSCGNTPPPTCDEPGGVNLTGVSASAVTVNWASSATALSYNVQIRPTSGGAWMTTNITGLTTTFTGLSTCTAYEVQLESVCDSTTSGYSQSYIFSTDGCGNTTSAYTDPIAFTTTGCSMGCDAPDNVVVTPINNDGGVLSWDLVPDAIEYIITIVPLDGSIPPVSTTVTSSPYTFTGLEFCSGYSVTVESICAGKTSASSNAGVILTPLDTSFPTLSERKCGSMDILGHQIAEDPSILERQQEIEEFTQKVINNGSVAEKQAVVYTIPTVVHILYSNTAENVSDAQVFSQIQVLNEDFRRTNADASNTPSAFVPVAADSEIEFCLATIDPNGNPTNGITRTSVSGSPSNPQTSAGGGVDAWPTGDYLNIWVVNLGGGLLGYAQFPGGNPATDGIVITTSGFGSGGSASAPFHLGRTATHEVGHWLNLRHIWGDGGCGQDDQVADTPLSDASNGGCNTGHVSCGTVDMVENYMDYSDDGCMNIFTMGQAARMRALFEPGGARASLLSSGACGTVVATCTDGIQNGTETGIDCGGQDCPACPTCFDGIQNGDEEGIDCGGSTCGPCNPNSTTIEFTTTGCCDAPTGLEVLSTTIDGAEITWQHVAEATSYNVQYQEIGSSIWTTISVSGPPVTLTGLLSCTEYDIQVESVCGAGKVSAATRLLTSENDLLSTPNFVKGEIIVQLLPDYGINSLVQVFNPHRGIDTDLKVKQVMNETQNSWLLEFDHTVISHKSILAILNNHTAVQSAQNRLLTTAASTDVNAFKQSACATPTGITANAIYPDAAILSWDFNPDVSSYNVQSRELGTTTWTIEATAGTTITFDNLSECTQYEVQVQAECSNGDISSFTESFIFTTGGSCGITSGYTDPISIMTGGCGGTCDCAAQLGTYCASNGGSAEEWIQLVEVADIFNDSGNSGGYGNFTDWCTDMTQGQSYPIALVPGYVDTQWDESWIAWIDFNQDGDFDDAGEEVYNSGGAFNTPVTGVVTVPADATLGCTAMRIAMKWSDPAGTATSCETFQYGEVEDYSVNILEEIVTPEDMYDLQFTNVSSTCDSVPQICATVQIRSAVTGQDFAIGSHTVFFTYNTDAINHPTYSSINFNNINPCGIGGTIPPYFSPMFTFDPVTGEGNLTTILQIPNEGCPLVTNDWLSIGEFCFETVDANLTLDLVIDANLTFFNQNDNTPEILQGDLFGYDDIASPCAGCTDQTAHNYNPLAEIDDGSCETCSDGIQNGDETGIDCGGSNSNCASCSVLCYVRLFLEGPYDPATGLMSTFFVDEGIMPLVQPYARPPWAYVGTEGVTNVADYPQNMTDWVLVELRDADDDMLVIEQKAGLLLSDGHVIDVETGGGIPFDNAVFGEDYHIVVRHRNHLAVMSASTVTLPNPSAPYDFSIAVEQAIGNAQQTEVDTGIFALYGGDFDSNGVFTVQDFNVYFSQVALINQYVDGDCTIDTNVSIADFNVYFGNSSIIGVSQIRY